MWVFTNMPSEMSQINKRIKTVLRLRRCQLTVKLQQSEGAGGGCEQLGSWSNCLLIQFSPLNCCFRARSVSCAVSLLRPLSELHCSPELTGRLRRQRSYSVFNTVRSHILLFDSKPWDRVSHHPVSVAAFCNRLRSPVLAVAVKRHRRSSRRSPAIKADSR